MQLENEIGILGSSRDRSDAANKAFASEVPGALKHQLESRRLQLSPELAAEFNPAGRTWAEVFQQAAGEAFSSWQYGRFLNALAEAGKKEYTLPVYANAQLPAPAERAGEYPSGGPHPYYLEIYRAAAPAIDFYSPDIYWPNFGYWVQRYTRAGYPAFIPEARLEAGPFNALYAYGEARAFGFSPFGIDSASAADPASKTSVAAVYSELDKIKDLILEAQSQKRIRGLVLHASSPRPTQTVSLGGYLFQASLSRAWPTNSLLTDDGAMLILEAAPGEFYVTGCGLTVTFTRDPDTDSSIAGIARVEQVSRNDGNWTVQRRLNGDQTNQGRQLTMSPHDVETFRVVLYHY